MGIFFKLFNIAKILYICKQLIEIVKFMSYISLTSIPVIVFSLNPFCKS